MTWPAAAAQVPSPPPLTCTGWQDNPVNTGTGDLRAEVRVCTGSRTDGDQTRFYAQTEVRLRPTAPPDLFRRFIVVTQLTGPQGDPVDTSCDRTTQIAAAGEQAVSCRVSALVNEGPYRASGRASWTLAGDAPTSSPSAQATDSDGPVLGPAVPPAAGPAARSGHGSFWPWWAGAALAALAAGTGHRLLRRRSATAV